MRDLVSIDGAPPVAPSKRADWLQGEWHAASAAVDQALYDAGLLPTPTISPGRNDGTGVHALRCREWFAMCHLTSFWERRTLALERSLRRALDNGLAGDLRQRVVEQLHGRGARRDATTLSELEQQLIDRYRAMDATGRQMIRTLFERLPSSSVDDTAQRGGA